jgi:polyisoprenoid-binding protein YceI
MRRSSPRAFQYVVIALALAVAPRLHAAQDLRADFDPQKTSIAFTLGAAMHEVHGVFQLKSGSIRFDRHSGTASGSLIVDAGSGASGSESRDSKMKHDILETSLFPEIVFTPKSVIGSVPEQGSATVQVHGVFRIHGTDHDVTLPVTLTVTGNTFQLTTTFPAPYVAWGMKDPSLFVLRVAKEVQITVKAAGTLVTLP